MRKLILKITAIATGCAIVLGAGYLAQAKNNKEVINTKVENLVDPIVKPVLAEEVHWFELNETNSSNPSDQTFKNITPMINPPLPNDNTGCAQAYNTGEYCAVALRFKSTPLNPIDTDLSGYSDLQDVLDNHPNAVEIVINVESIDEDEDGYSRKPL